MEKILKKASFEAGKILKQNFGKISKSDIIEKKQNDFLTFVDEQSEEKIINIIHNEFPDHSILAEEKGRIDNKSDYCWIIDPLDGTKNYICGIPVFAVSIALQKNKEIVYSAVFDVMQDDLYFAEKGKGAFRNNTKLTVSNVNMLDKSLLATGFPFKKKKLLKQYLNCFEEIFIKCSGMRRMGTAAIDLAYLAAGRFQGFWEIGLQPWDMAAGNLLITEAGGKVTDFWGNPEHLYNSYIVAGNNRIHALLVEIIKRHFPKNQINKLI